jgi:hypothetical protein
MAGACSDDEPQSNNGSDSGVSDSGQVSDSDGSDADDAGDTSQADASEGDASDGDTGGSGCLQVEISATMSEAFLDGPVVEYSLEASPAIEGEVRLLSILFERYMTATYVGTFELGTGADDNFGTCAHCLYIRTDTRDRAFFADRGTLVSNSDPYSRRIDLSVSDLRLIEVEVDEETRSSTPVEDGLCIEVADFSHEGVYPPQSWTCPAENYGNGQACNCECGAFDPDCSTSSCLPGDPACSGGPGESLPIVGCEAEEVCVIDPLNQQTMCAETCDWAARTGCTGTATCVFDSGAGDGDLCLSDNTRVLSGIEVGESCPITGLQSVCDVNEGFAEGYCGPNNVCRSVCESDADCTDADHTCRKFAQDDGLGYCGPVPTDG